MEFLSTWQFWLGFTIGWILGFIIATIFAGSGKASRMKEKRRGWPVEIATKNDPRTD